MEFLAPSPAIAVKKTNAEGFLGNNEMPPFKQTTLDVFFLGFKSSPGR
jgi:hypothetical protein